MSGELFGRDVDSRHDRISTDPHVAGRTAAGVEDAQAARSTPAVLQKPLEPGGALSGRGWQFDSRSHSTAQGRVAPSSQPVRPAGFSESTTMRPNLCANAAILQVETASCQAGSASAA